MNRHLKANGLRPFYLYLREPASKMNFTLVNATASQTMPLRIRKEYNQEKAGIRPEAELILRGHNGNNWDKGILTGLIPINGLDSIFFGDHSTIKGKNLLLIGMEENAILIKYFRFFYSNNPSRIYDLGKTFKMESNEVFNNRKKGAETPFLKRSKSIGKTEIYNSKI